MPFTQSNLVVDDLEVTRLHANNGHTIGPKHLKDEHAMSTLGSVFYMKYTLEYGISAFETNNATNRDLTIALSRDATDVFEVGATIFITELDPAFSNIGNLQRSFVLGEHKIKSVFDRDVTITLAANSAVAGSVTSVQTDGKVQINVYKYIDLSIKDVSWKHATILPNSVYENLETS
eukprot:1768692-Pleurochrysis_carterae.AAC.2